MDPDDLSPEEAHPWLDEPDDLTDSPTLPQTAVRHPFAEPGGQTVPSFTHESGVLEWPDDPPTHTGRAMAIYAMCVLLCLTGLFIMFFVLGGRFVQFTRPVAVAQSHAIAGGQTGNAPTPTPLPRPTVTPQPVRPTPASVPVIGIKPVHPIPLPPQPPTLTHPAPVQPTPVRPDPVATPTLPPMPTATASPDAASDMVVAPSALKLACHPEIPETMPGTIAFTIHNTSDQPLGWTIILSGNSDFDITPTSGILGPDARQRVFITNIASSGSLVVSSNLGDFPVTFDLC